VITGRVDFYLLSDLGRDAVHHRGQSPGLGREAVPSARRPCLMCRPPSRPASRIPISTSGVGAFVPQGPTPAQTSSQSFIVRPSRAIENPLVKEKLAKIGVESMVLTPDEFDAPNCKRSLDRRRPCKKAANIPMQ